MDRLKSAIEDYIGGEGDENDRMRAIGSLVRDAYLDFCIGPVHEFVESVLPRFPGKIDRAIRSEIEPEFELTRTWRERLTEVADERLSNELLEHIKGNNLSLAEQTVQILLESARDDQQRKQRLRSVAYTLGGMLHERDRAASLIKSIAKAPSKFGVATEAALEMDIEYQKSLAAAARRERPAVAASRTNLTQCIVELSHTLPARNALHEPSRPDEDNFNRNLRAIARCGLISSAHNRLNELTLLLVEFSPKEVSSAGALAGVEQRLYGTLGRTARSVAANVISSLGAHSIFFESYFSFAKAHIASNIGKYISESLGLLKNPAATAFLIEVIQNPKLEMNTEAIFALGTIADERAQKALLNLLQTNLNARVIEGTRRREIYSLIGALARAARQLDPAQRNRILATVIKAIPKTDTELGIRVALSYFTGKMEELDPALLNWAAQVATIALWNIDRPELARAARSSPLGFRQPLLDLMQRLAPFALEAINRTALEQAKTFNGAYLAIGEFYSKVSDVSAIPVLKQLLFNTFLHDDQAPKSAYARETVLDTATDERSEIDKDKILASLIYSVDKIGGDEAQQILSDLFDQIQTGRLPRPGRESADILMQAHMRMSKAAPSDSNAMQGAQAHKSGVTENDLQLLRELEAGYVLQSKRRAKKVAAMAQLAQRKFAAAIPAITSHLADKDPIVSSAALTALLDFGVPSSPAPVQARLHEELFRALVSDDNVQRVKVAEVLKKLNPMRSPLKERLKELSGRQLPLAARSIITSLLAAGSPGTPANAGNFADSNSEQNDAPAANAKVQPVAVSALDKKRAYILARQEWIRNGKRGPEPRPE
jgi:HEAT repeat protein